MAEQESITRYDIGASLGFSGAFQCGGQAEDLTEADAIALAKCIAGLPSFQGVSLTKTETNLTRTTADLAADPVVFE